MKAAIVLGIRLPDTLFCLSHVEPAPVSGEAGRGGEQLGFSLAALS